MDIRKNLSQVDLFNGLSLQQLDEVASIVADKKYNKGELIFTDGDDGIGFYIVISGRVKVYKVSPDGKEQIMHIFGPGQLNPLPKSLFLKDRDTLPMPMPWSPAASSFSPKRLS